MRLSEAPDENENDAKNIRASDLAQKRMNDAINISNKIGTRIE